MNEVNSKLISIIMPTYNVEHYIAGSINSILSQESQNYKLIIVDDHSTDRTVEIINKEFEAEIQSKLITLIILNKNSGPSTARQTGLDYVNTPYVTFIDSDDSYLSTKVTTILEERINKYAPDCLMFKYITDHGRIKFKKKYNLPQNRLLTSKEALIKKITASHPIWHYIWNKCYKTSIIKEHHIHFQKELRVAEDVRFNEDFLLHSHNLLFINQYLYSYNCTNSQSISKTSSNNKGMSIEDFHKRLDHCYNQYERITQYTKILNCEQECSRVLKYDLCSAIVSLLNQSKKYPWYLKAKKHIETSSYYSQIRPLYFRCFIKYNTQSWFRALKSFVKTRL